MQRYKTSFFSQEILGEERIPPGSHEENNALMNPKTGLNHYPTHSNKHFFRTKRFIGSKKYWTQKFYRTQKGVHKTVEGASG